MQIEILLNSKRFFFCFFLFHVLFPSLTDTLGNIYYINVSSH